MAEQLEAEINELREHAADTVGFLIGPGLTIDHATSRYRVGKQALLRSLTGDANTRLDWICRLAHKCGYRVRLVLEPLEGE